MARASPLPRLDSRLTPCRPLPWAALVLGLAVGCSDSGRPDPGFVPATGALEEKPGGGFFLADPHRGGGASRVRLLEIGWGRLVDVHDVDERGRANPIPVLRDVVIGEGIVSDGVDVELTTNPVADESRLVVLRPRDAADTGSGTFQSILARLSGRLGPIQPKHDDGSASPPFSYVPRNGTLVLRFDDLLEDGPEARARLFETVRLTAGYPPLTPQVARIVFDPSHGGLADGVFHSTRVLIDCAVSAEEALELPFQGSVNVAGLPASSPQSPLANAAVHLATRIDPARGRFARLTNLAGGGLRPEGPVEAATQDLVRAFRAGGAADTNSGFLLDFTPPRLVGTWNLSVEDARIDPLGPPGHAYEVDLAFATPCRDAPRRGDTLQLGGELYEVREPALPPDPSGRVAGVQLLRLAAEPLLGDSQALLGLGLLFTPYRASALPPACWVTFSPPPAEPPARGISEGARILLRFSEPMDPTSFRAFDSFRILRGAGGSGDDVRAGDLVVGTVRVAQNLQEFSFEPRLPLGDRQTRRYRFELAEGPTAVRDLAGTVLTSSFVQAGFELSAPQTSDSSRGFALRFESRDELDPADRIDVRGQIVYEAGVLRPRATAFASYSADRGNPVPGLMLPFSPGVQTPLSPLGSRLQAIWRYADFGFRVRDESLYNLDVIGLSWSPAGGAVVADFFPLFELRLGHGRYLPDESHPPFCAPVYPSSGLNGAPFAFTTNQLADPRGDPVVVHPRNLGYRVRPADLTRNEQGTALLPFPWNHSGAPLTTFTWRDTAVLAKGGLRGSGVPLDIEVGPPLGLDLGVGSAGASGHVPTIGLPLLWEVRCFPSSGSLGLNAFDIMLPVPGWSTPNFRAYSTGGIDEAGRAVPVDPDLATTPSGGFNPGSRPPGRPTALTADNSFYIGQIDTVLRVSRAVTIWIDTGNFAPRFAEPVIEPREQPGQASLVVEYRGADGFSPESGDAPFDADLLDSYGDFPDGTTFFHGDGQWSDDIRSADGARFLQLRFSFLNDIASGLSPELDSVGVAFRE